MKSLSRPQIKRLTAVHGWSGVILGLLLYAVVVTGTVVVFAQEIAVWSIGGVQTEAPFEGALDAKVRPLIETVTKGYHEEIGVWANARGEIMVFPHAHTIHPDTRELADFGTLFRIDGTTGELLSRKMDFIWHDPANYDTSALREFLVGLHVQLSMPDPWGLIVTGILGLLMMAAGVTGFLMHRHLIRDLFVAERPGKRLVSARDRHILAASWALPFAFLLGFTGSFFSFAGTVSFPLVATVAFGGDEHKMADALFEPPVTPDASPAVLANLDNIVAQSTKLASSPAIFVGISRYGQADSRLSVWHEPPDGSLNYVHNVFAGKDGAFIERRPSFGNEPTAGSFIYGLMGPLHFGDFAGILSKSVWVGLGAAMCFVILTGMRLWIRRREEDALWRGFARAVTVTAYGLPLAMLASAYTFFGSLSSGDPFWWTPAGFVIASTVCIVAAFIAPDDNRLAHWFQQALFYGCVGLPVMRMAGGGTGWIEALAHGHGAVLSLDLLLLVVAALLFVQTRQGIGFANMVRIKRHSPGAAE